MSTAEAVTVAIDESFLWIDPETGAVVTPGEEGAIKIDKWEVQLPAGARTLALREDYSWLRPWYLRRNGHVASERKSLMANYKERLKQLDAIDRHLAHSWMEKLAPIVRQDIDDQPGKKKSIVYLEGKAGWRNTPKCEVTSEDEAIEWAHKYCPDAVRTTVNLLVSQLPKEEDPDNHKKKIFTDVPGVKRWTQSNFFATGDRNLKKEEEEAE